VEICSIPSLSSRNYVNFNVFFVGDIIIISRIGIGIARKSSDLRVMVVPPKHGFAPIKTSGSNSSDQSEKRDAKKSAPASC
jgi:hypothetical protein